MIKSLVSNLPHNKNSDFLAIINANIDILFHKNKIIGINNNIQKNTEIKDINFLDAKGLIITSGLFDSHIHGGFGCYFNNFEETHCSKLLKELPKHGITSIFATIMTDSDQNLKNSIKKVKNFAKNEKKYTKIEGIHLEGPYLSKDFAGIHPKEHLKNPSIEHFRTIQDDFIKMVTFAPELDNGNDFQHFLRSQNIIPAGGHSGAKAQECEEIELVTHVFNAMPKLHHRDLNILSKTLTDKNIKAEVIADGEHISQEILKIIFKLKSPEEILLISDCLPIAGCQDGEFLFGGQKIQIKNKKAQNADGTMAGSIMFLDEIGQNLIKDGIISFDDFIKMSSITPRAVHNLPYKIEIGENTDIVLWQETNVKFSIIDGKIY